MRAAYSTLGWLSKERRRREKRQREKAAPLDPRVRCGRLTQLSVNSRLAEGREKAAGCLDWAKGRRVDILSPLRKSLLKCGKVRELVFCRTSLRRQKSSLS